MQYFPRSYDVFTPGGSVSEVRRTGKRGNMDTRAECEGLGAALEEWTESELAVPRPRLARRVESLPHLSIRIPSPSTIARCELCGKIFPAQGPTGYYEEWPICDRCLLEHSNQLGMIMALGLFTRTYARLAAEGGVLASEAATEMLAFAKVYELFADAYGPPRPLDFAGLGVFGKSG